MINICANNTSTYWPRKEDKNKATCIASLKEKQAQAYVQRNNRAKTASPPPRTQEQNSSGSPLCCEKVDKTDIPLQSFASNRAPGPRSSSQSTSHCTFLSSKVSGFHVPMSVVLPWSRAEHQFTPAHDAPSRSRRPLE